MGSRLYGTLLLCPFVLAGSDSVVAQSPTAPTILRFLDGVDRDTRPMAPAEVAQLNDPWAVLVLRKNVFPKDLASALAALDPVSGTTAYSDQQSFFVSESGQLPIGAVVAREFRIVVLRGQLSSPAILMSAPAGSREGFIELMSWDPAKKAFNFYRRPKGTDWIWRGDTHDAFRSGTAGKGCFECHVHGAPIMKEMRSPWNNWHSQSATIPPEAIPSEDIRMGPLFDKKSEADRLEPIVRAWENRAATEQVRSQITQAGYGSSRLLARPLFVTDTVNLRTSLQRSHGVKAVDLPSEFFLNFDLLESFLNLNDLPKLKIERPLYEQSLKAFEFKLSDGVNFTQVGDTHFGFLVPIPAELGTAMVKQLIAERAITDHFALCVALVDFPNPVYSSLRASLWKYVPETSPLPAGPGALGEMTANAIIAAAPGTSGNSPNGDSWTAGTNRRHSCERTPKSRFTTTSPHWFPG